MWNVGHVILRIWEFIWELKRVWQICRVELLNYDLITMLFKVMSIETKEEKGNLATVQFFHFEID